MTPNQKLAVARLIVSRRSPYLTTAVTSLVPQELKGLGTLAVTDRAVLLWDPEFVEKVQPDELAAVLIHEAQHVLRDHHLRCKRLGAVPEVANFTEDAEINDDIQAMGLKLPHPVTVKTLNEMFGTKLKEGGLWEEYYNEIRQKAKELAAKIGQGKPDGGGGWCGSAAGRPVPGEPQGGGRGGKDDEQKPGGGAGAEGRSEADLRRIRQATAEAIRQEAGQKGRGSVPAGLLRWADEQLAPPKIPWQQKLARACRSAVAFRAGATDYSYSRPSRRQGGVGFGIGRPIMPVLRSPVPQVAIAVDTSGSMSQADLRRALSEARGIMVATGAQVQFIACDAEVHSNRKVRSWQEMLPLVKGGGGTSFIPVFDALARERNIDVLVFATDGCGPAPSRPPRGMKVIWLLVGQCRQKPYVSDGDGYANHGVVPYGEFVEVDD